MNENNRHDLTSRIVTEVEICPGIKKQTKGKSSSEYMLAIVTILIKEQKYRKGKGIAGKHEAWD